MHISPRFLNGLFAPGLIPILLACILPVLAVDGFAQTCDILIKNGFLIDGTGKPGFAADLAITGDAITAVGPNLHLNARKVIDAKGQIVSPGFIDMHTHSESSLLEDGRAASFLMQGVTTQLLGEHSSAGPLVGKAEQSLFSLTEDAGTKPIVPDWTTLGGYFKRLQSQHISLNVASLVGAGQVRACAVGYEDRAATPQELARMKELVAEAMRDGAVGLSSAMAYVPNAFSRTDELAELAKAAGQYGGYYATHLRSSSREDPLSGLKEALTIGEQAKVPVEIIHINSTAGARITEFAALIDSARARGLDVTANVYPYIAGMSFLRSLLPSWAQEGGTDAMLARLRNPETRERIRNELSRSDAVRWERTYVSSTNRTFDGKTISQLAAERKVDPAVALMDVVLGERGYAFYISFGNTEENLAKAMLLPWVHFGSDGASITIETYQGGKPHPRFLGTFARVLSKYVREEHLMTLEAAVHKMTSHSARRLRFADRGELAPGKKADVVVFDAVSIQDRATFEQPLQYASGVSHVLVNGVAVVEGGKHTGAKPGRVLRGSSPEKSK